MGASGKNLLAGKKLESNSTGKWTALGAPALRTAKKGPTRMGTSSSKNRSKNYGQQKNPILSHSTETPKLRAEQRAETGRKSYSASHSLEQERKGEPEKKFVRLREEDN